MIAKDSSYVTATAMWLLTFRATFWLVKEQPSYVGRLRILGNGIPYILIPWLDPVAIGIQILFRAAGQRKRKFRSVRPSCPQLLCSRDGETRESTNSRKSVRSVNGARPSAAAGIVDVNRKQRAAGSHDRSDLTRLTLLSRPRAQPWLSRVVHGEEGEKERARRRVSSRGKVAACIRCVFSA
jgi:hypothetical protein